MRRCLRRSSVALTLAEHGQVIYEQARPLPVGFMSTVLVNETPEGLEGRGETDSDLGASSQTEVSVLGEA